jgi:hypothetical protein
MFHKSTFLKSTYVLANFSDKRIKGIIDAHASFGRGFDERYAKMASLLSGIVHVHIASRQIAFIANEDHRHLFCVLDSFDLLSIRRYVIKGFGIVDSKN